MEVNECSVTWSPEIKMGRFVFCGSVNLTLKLNERESWKDKKGPYFDKSVILERTQ